MFISKKIDRRENTRMSWQLDGKETINASANPDLSNSELDNSGVHIVYDKQEGDGFKKVYGYESGRLLTTTSKYGLDTDNDGLLIHSQQPVISSDARFIAYLEVSPDSVSFENSCQVHFYDRVSEKFERQSCPDPVIKNPTDWKAEFINNAQEIQWYNILTTEKFILRNPLSIHK